MPSSDVILTIWDDPRNVDTLKAMWADGKSATQIATAIPGASRSAVLGKVRRLKLQKRTARVNPLRARTINGREGHRGASGGLGQAKANSIVYRVEGRLKAERARQEGKLSHRGQEPFRVPGRVDVDDEGVDATHLCGIMDLGSAALPSRCRWIHGDPTADAQFCGKPTKAGSSWCPDHHERVYPQRASL